MPVNFSVRTRSTQLVNDQDSDNVADGGDVIRTTLTFHNTGTAALDVTIQDLLKGSTLLPGSVKIGPMAVDDVATITGNTPKTFTFAELLGNDIDPDGSNATMTITGVSGAAHGTVTIDTVAKTVTFTPETGYQGAAQFNYSVADAQGLTNVAGFEGTVNVTISGQVWYVDQAYGGANGASDGSYLRPFTSLTNLNDDGTVGTGRFGPGDGIAGDDDVDSANDTIFVYDRGANAINGGITLEAGQKLFGDAHTFVVNGISIGASGNQTRVNSTDTDYGVTLSTGNEIQGINLHGTTSTTTSLRDGGGNVGSFTMGESSISGLGQAVDIDQGGTLNVTLTSLSSDSSTAEGVQLAGTAANLLTGSFAANAGTIQNANGTGFLVGVAGGGTASSGGSINVTYAGDLTNNGASATNAIEIQDRTGGTVTFSGAVTEGAGPGILIDGNAGTVTFSSSVSLSTTTSNALTLSNNTGTVNFTGANNGLDITTTSGVGLTMTNGGTLNVQGSGNSITTTTGQIVNINGGTVGSSGITFATMTGGTYAGTVAAVRINDLDGTGTFNGGNVTIAGTSTATVDGILIGGGSAANFSFGTVAVGTATTVGGDGIEINGAGNGTVTMSSATINGTAESAIEINGATNSVTISGGTIGATNDAGADTVLISGGTGAVTINATLSNNTANANLININGHTTGTVAFGGTLSSTAGAGGIDINNSSGTINFTGANSVLTTAGNTAINITNNSAAINFTGGNLDITTTGPGDGINASSAGSITVTGSGNSISTVNGEAVNISGTDIGAGGMTFESINASDPTTNGIILANTGSGFFTVTGTGGADTGGTINSAGGHGISLTDTGPVSLTQMNITNSVDDGIFGNGVRGLTLNNVDVANNGNAVNDRGVEITNLSGTATFTNSRFTNNAEDQVYIRNTGGDLNLTVTGSTFTGTGVAPSNDGLLIIGTGTGTIDASITGNTFNNSIGDHLQYATETGGVMTANLTISGNVMGTSGINAGGGILVNTGGAHQTTVDINGNTINRMTGTAIATVVNTDSVASHNLNATIRNNNVGTNGVNLSGSTNGYGILVQSRGEGTQTTLVQNNIIRETADYAMNVIVGDGSGTVNLTITGNQLFPHLGDPNFNREAIHFNIGQTATNVNGEIDHPTLRLDFGGAGALANTMDGGPLGAGGDWWLRQRFGSRVELEGYAGGAFDDAAVAAYLNGRNNETTPGVASHVDNPNFSTDGYHNVTVNGGNVPTPPLPTFTALLVQTPPDPADTSGSPKTLDHAGEIPPPLDDGDDDGTGTGTGTDTDTGTSGSDPSHPVIVDDGVLSQAELDYLVDAAIQRWIDAGASDAQVAAMRAANISVADMTGVYLGTSNGSDILIDADGGGTGWFLDLTPNADEEYQGSGTRLTAVEGGAAAGRVDLLTVLMHELGHQAGLSDHYVAADRDDVMYGYTWTGERRLPADGQAQDATPGSVANTAFALGPISVGTVPGDNAFIVQYDSTVNAVGEDRLVQHFNVAADIGWREVTLGPISFASTNSELLVVDSLSLGNRIFLDANANGIFDLGDSGIANVSLTLFADTNNNGVYDAGVDQAISYIDNDSSGTYDPAVDTPAAAGDPGAVALTVTTDASGFYAFNYLAPGDYIVRVDASNFLSGGALDGRVVYGTAADPNNNFDNDNNGQAFTGFAATRSIRLDYGLETTAGPTGPGNDTNNTLDVAFIDTNQAPVNSVPVAVQTFNEDGTLTFNAANGNLISVSDADAGAGNLTVTLSIQTGTLTLGGNAGLVSLTGDGTNNVSLTGTQAAVNNALNGLVYNPGANYNGNRTLTITTNDLGNTGVDPGLSGDSTSEQDSDTVSIHVTAINDAPVVIGDGTVDADPIVEDAPTAGQTVNALFSGQYSDQADAQFSVSNPGGSSPGSFAGVAVVANGSSPATGQWQYFDTNTSTWVDIGARSTSSALLIGSGTAIRFNPALDFTGTAPTLTVNLIDNSLGFGITFGQVVDISGVGATGGSTAYSTGTVVLSQEVTPANIAPVLDLDGDDSNSVGTGYSGSYTEGGAAAAISDTDVSITDGDAGDDIVSATITITNAEAGDVLNVGTLPATISVDLASTSTTVILTAAPGTSAADFQAAIEAITYSNTGDNPADFATNNSRSITVVVNDGTSNSNVATATIAITDTNDAPSGTSATITAIEDTARVLTVADLGFSDVDGTFASVTISAVSGGGIYFDADGTAGAGTPVLATVPGTFTAQDLIDGKVSFRADPNANGPGLGTITFTVTDDDGADAASANVLTVDVTAVNDQPNVPNSPTVNATEQTPITINAGFTVSDADLDARNGGAGDYSGAAFIINRNGSNPDDLFSFDTSGALFTVNGSNIEVGGVVIATLAQSGGILNINFVNNGTPPTTALVNDVLRHLQYTNVSESPPASVDLIYILDDGAPGGGQGVVTPAFNNLDGGQVTINIASVNDRPVITLADSTVSGTEDQQLVFSVAAGNGITLSDLDHPSLNITIYVNSGTLTLATTSGLSVSGNGTGSVNLSGTIADINAALDGLVYRGNLNFNGSDTLNIIASDGVDLDFDQVAISLAPDGTIDGTSGNDTLDGTPNPDFFRVQQGGDDVLRGFGGNDVFLFLGALTGADQVDGGTGSDQIAIQGNYSGPNALTLGTGIVSVESLAILPGSDTRFGDPGTNFYDYDITTRDVNVAAGAQLVVDANRLRAGEDLTFNGSAETDGSFFIYGGGGVDTLTGGAQNDVFLFGSSGQWGSSDVVNGGPGGIDQLALRGDYTITFGAGQLISIESIALVSAHDTRFGTLGDNYDYNLTMNNGNVAAGVQMTVDGAPLRATETLVFNGTAELDGTFRVFGGAGNDVITGGAGNDILVGRNGADTLRGGGGADVFRYDNVSESTSAGRDGIQDFTLGDIIDLSRIDANANTAGNDAFTFIGNAAFSGTAGELRAEISSGPIWLVSADVNGDGVSDFEVFVVVTGGHVLGAGDFVF